MKKELEMEPRDIADIPAASLWALCISVDAESGSLDGLHVYKHFKGLMKKKEAEKLKVKDEPYKAKGLEDWKIQETEDARRCDICGKLYSYWNTHAFSIVSRPNNLFNRECQEEYLTVCSKCLPNLSVMVDIAILETSRIMAAAREEARKQ